MNINEEMKRLIGILAVILLMMVASINTTEAQVIVKVKPVRPKVVVVKPAKARANHVWIGGHWAWSRRAHKYVWVKGHWARKKRGKVWVTGSWKKVPAGWKYVSGHWRSA